MLEYLFLAIGFIFLIKGANYLIEGSSYLAKKLGVSSLIIGFTVVAFGTSMPELIINIFSALKGSTDLAIGNVIGSNISNILLILGLSAIIYPLSIHKSTIWNEIPISLFATILFFVLANNAFVSLEPHLGRLDGLFMLVLFGFFLVYIYKSSKYKKEYDKKINTPKEEHSKSHIALLILGGLFGILMGGKLVVENAILIANLFGISDFLISATVMAIGSSLPELIVSLIAVSKRNIDLAVGTIVGSNIFNLLYVMGITSLISPIKTPLFANFDIFLLIFANLLLFVFMFTSKKHKLERWEGIIFVLIYLIYIFLIILRG